MKATIHHCNWITGSNVMANIKTEEVELPKEGLLEYLQNLVGGWIEIYHHNGHDLVFNEEGLLKGLPLNPWAYFQGFHFVGTIIEIHGLLP